MARDYNGSSSRIDWAISAPSTSFTLCCWLYLDVDADAYPLGVYDASNTLRQHRIEYVGTGNTIRANSSSFNSTGFTISTGTWYHLAALFTVSSTNVTQCQLYLDGSADTAGTGSQNVSNTDRMTAGVTGDSTAYGYLNGALHEQTYYAKLLSAGEISALASGASPLVVAPASILHYVPNDSIVDIIGGITGTDTSTSIREGRPSSLGGPIVITRTAAAGVTTRPQGPLGHPFAGAFGGPL